MDILYHALTGVTISKGMGSEYAIPAAVSAMLPDLAGIWPFYYYKIIEAAKHPNNNFARTAFILLTSNKFANVSDTTAYRFTHSLLSAGIFALLSYLLMKDAWIVMTAGFISHLIIDIPTHSGPFATRLLYPFSDIHFRGGTNWAKNAGRFIFFWIVLGLVSLWIWRTS